MVRNIAGFAVFAFLAAMALKLFLGFFGWIFAMLLTVLVWALIGFAIYTVLKIFMPDTASKLKSSISGK